MNKQELLNKIEELETKVAELKAEANKPEEQPKYGQAFVPDVGQSYYFITDAGYIKDVDYDRECTGDLKRLGMGNCYRTRQDAEREVERRKITHELQVLAGDFVPDFTNYYSPSRYLIQGYSFENKRMVMASFAHYARGAIPAYFRTEESLKAAIKTVGEARIIRAFFDADYKGTNDEG